MRGREDISFLKRSKEANAAGGSVPPFQFESCFVRAKSSAAKLYDVLSKVICEPVERTNFFDHAWD
jgi:S-adenosylmethionine:diacylglycerol 3-amino-3-carboxypropyl transferase